MNKCYQYGMGKGETGVGQPEAEADDALPHVHNLLHGMGMDVSDDQLPLGLPSPHTYGSGKSSGKCFLAQ
jgi:hypothetical protein